MAAQPEGQQGQHEQSDEEGDALFPKRRPPSEYALPPTLGLDQPQQAK
jgi:hypothetical protein